MSESLIPYARQWIEDDDIEAVLTALRSPYLTTGPFVERFEDALAGYVGARHAVAMNSGTSALYSTLTCLGIGSGDEVIVPTLTFVATASAVLHTGARPVFADVESDTLLVDPEDVESRITSRTRAVIAVDYAGQPCDYDRLRTLCQKHGLALIADACHSLGASYRGRKAGSLADATVFSFHPVKPLTTGEGGAVTTDDPALAERLRRFRNHGIDRTWRERSAEDDFAYDVEEPGWNFRITDLQCALGLSQLRRCDEGRRRRERLVKIYSRELTPLSWILLPAIRDDAESSHHLFVALVDFAACGVKRSHVMEELARAGIGTNVHYRPAHLLSLMRKRLGTGYGLCPVAEKLYERLLSLPLYVGLEEEGVIEISRRLIQAVSRKPVHSESASAAHEA
ncbi:MAG: UDP-4-amino-4,6-dideoxy-N-acetyl-beta-L-altrosami ne transaminase [Acidobacteriota bacterium]